MHRGKLWTASTACRVEEASVFSLLNGFSFTPRVGTNVLSFSWALRSMFFMWENWSVPTSCFTLLTRSFKVLTQVSDWGCARTYPPNRMTTAKCSVLWSLCTLSVLVVLFDPPPSLPYAGPLQPARRYCFRGKIGAESWVLLSFPAFHHTDSYNLITSVETSWVTFVVVRNKWEISETCRRSVVQMRWNLKFAAQGTYRSDYWSLY